MYTLQQRTHARTHTPPSTTFALHFSTHWNQNKSRREQIPFSSNSWINIGNWTGAVREAFDIDVGWWHTTTASCYNATSFRPEGSKSLARTRKHTRTHTYQQSEKVRCPVPEREIEVAGEGITRETTSEELAGIKKKWWDVTILNRKHGLKSYRLHRGTCSHLLL